MKNSTAIYVKMHTLYIAELIEEKRQSEIQEYQTLYDHMHNYLLNIGLSDEQAASIVTDFRGGK